MNISCMKCKGRGYCGREFCAVYAKAQGMFKAKPLLEKEEFFGSAPAPFVGHHGYPDINVGILSPAEIREDAWEFDAPKYWAEHDYKIPRIIDLRSSLVNSRFKANIKQASKYLEIAQLVGMSAKPVDVEFKLKKKPVFRMNFEAHAAPMGPNALIEKASITENPKIPQKVDKVVSDTDLKANDAVVYLYQHGFDENRLSELLSVGTLGVKTDRKLVPTRWSITATDDVLAKHLLEQIRFNDKYEYAAFFGGYLGNYYLHLFFPEVWSYELFETYVGKSVWHDSTNIDFMTDYEAFEGRKDYADNCAGGYYAARLGVAEHLNKIKKQASVLSLRFITGEYAVPLGVWVCRQASRKSLSQKPIYFASKELMLNYARLIVKKKFGVDVDFILRESKLLREMNNQRKLYSFFS